MWLKQSLLAQQNVFTGEEFFPKQPLTSSDLEIVFLLNARGQSSHFIKTCIS